MDSWSIRRSGSLGRCLWIQDVEAGQAVDCIRVGDCGRTRNGACACHEGAVQALAMSSLSSGMDWYEQGKRLRVYRLRAALASADTLNNLSRYGARLFADEAPGALDVAQLGGGLADAEAERELVI